MALLKPAAAVFVIYTAGLVCVSDIFRACCCRLQTEIYRV